MYWSCVWQIDPLHVYSNSSPLMVYTTLNSTAEQARANLTLISSQTCRVIDLLLMLQPQISLDHAWDKWVTEIAWHSITSAISQTMIIVEAEHFEGHSWHVTWIAEVFVVRLWPESNPQTLKTCVFQSRGSLLCTIALSHLYHRLNLLVILLWYHCISLNHNGFLSLLFSLRMSTRRLRWSLGFKHLAFKAETEI